MTQFWCEHAVVDSAVRDGVLIETLDAKIASITADAAPTPSAMRLAGLTLPGFANAHSHAFHRALRARTQKGQGTFWTWREVMYEAAERLEPDGYHRLARATFAEMACAGISCVGEFHYLHHGRNGTPYDDQNEMGAALLAAASEAGIRITLLDTLYLHGGLDSDGYRPPAGAQQRYSDGTAAAWIERVDAMRASEHVRIGCAIHSVRAVDPEAMAQLSLWARERSAPLHAHVSEQVAENEQCQAHHGCTPVELLNQAGALGENFTAVHATHLTDHDIALLGSSGSAVCLCPTTERDLGDGIGPTVPLTAAEVSISLGSDSHAIIDHCEEMRAVELNERLASQQRGLHRATHLLDMATKAGHAGLGWTDAGSIAVGNRADLTTIDLSSPRTAGAPPELGIEAAAFAASASDVRTVVIDGELVVDDGRHLRLDVAAELSAAIAEVFA